MTRTWQLEERLVCYIPSPPLSPAIASGGWPHVLQMESGGCGHLIRKPCSIAVVHQIPLFSWRLTKSPRLYPRYILRISYINSTTSAKFSRWDSNAEPIGSRKFKFGFEGRTDPDNDDEEDDDDDYEGRGGRGGARKKRRKRRWWSDGPSGMEEEEPDIWEEFIDSIWIIKVFQSYGWASPAIILSWLLATGPKAFLFVLALPLGQSILTFAFTKLWESTQGKGKTKRKRRRKWRQQTFASAASAGNLDDDDDEQKERQESVKRRMGYKSWVGNDNGPVNEGSGNATHFGGWDELDDGMGSTMGRTQRSSKKAGRSRRRPSVANGRFSKGARESEMPLLLRLLIAAFPFLGSWTRML